MEWLCMPFHWLLDSYWFDRIFHIPLRVLFPDSARSNWQLGASLCQETSEEYLSGPLSGWWFCKISAFQLCRCRKNVNDCHGWHRIAISHSRLLMKNGILLMELNYSIFEYSRFQLLILGQLAELNAELWALWHWHFHGKNMKGYGQKPGRLLVWLSTIIVP